MILPEARRLDRLRQMIAIEPEPDPLRRLAALIDVDWRAGPSLSPSGCASRMHGAIGCRALPRHGRSTRRATPAPSGAPSIGSGAERYRDLVLLSAAEGAVSRERLAEFLALARDWTPPVFPLTGRDVTALGIPPGPRVGRLLDAVREWWEAGDFTADREACLAYLEEFATPGAPGSPDSIGNG